MKKISWFIWGVITLGIVSYFGYELMFKKQKPNFLPGAVTHGHFQIEMACDTCHTDPFGGGEVIQDACVGCHGDDLKAALDSHPRKKFTDPRNADMLDILDARYCASCHMEHQDAMISEMGVSLPSDYCYHCHQEIGEERESHKDLPYDSCQSAGCHNYHDNRALYEGFLAKHVNEPDYLSVIQKPANYYAENLAELARLNGFSAKPLSKENADKVPANPAVMDEWAHSSHAAVGVNCDQCHVEGDLSAPLQPEDCKACHAYEVDTFLKGKHGMRLAVGLTPMSPDYSALPMHKSLPEGGHKELGCDSCHQAHTFDTQFAAVDACLGCHNDEHSNNFKQSKHFELFTEGDERAVSCATCHMPLVEADSHGAEGFRVNHNQNDTLRPNEKMIRPVCMDCHGLQFSMNALADKALIKRNFNGKPGVHIKSIEWVEKRDQHKNEGVY